MNKLSSNAFAPAIYRDVPSAVPIRTENVKSFRGLEMLQHSGPELMSLLKLSHTRVEHEIYQGMLDETRKSNRKLGHFSVRSLMTLTGLNSYSTIRRGRQGLLSKLSIERHSPTADEKHAQIGAVYTVFDPEEIFERRQSAGQRLVPKEFERVLERRGLSGAVEHVAACHDLSRREAQVALCCVEGLTNCEIGNVLFISEQTVKFHLRHIFVKFGVRRRAELISQLLLFTG